MRKQIDKVRLSYLSDVRDTRYSDNEVEDQLLKFFKQPSSYQDRDRLLKTQFSWPMYYHLSPMRGNLLRWYQFKSSANVLEIGAGCGAITEGLVKKDIKLTAIELTERRSLINAYRNHHNSNLDIVVGNLQEYKPRQRFDYVICVGVLEYAGSFIESNEPYKLFVSRLKSLLKTNGRLMLAIENRFGLKYLAGAKEDHTLSFFDNLNGYPSRDVQTFGKRELAELLKSVGFHNLSFYYPFPDYKFPLAIFSDEFLPGRDCDFPLGLLPTPTLDQERYFLFSEQSAMTKLEANHLFDQFANSFLVEAA